MNSRARIPDFLQLKQEVNPNEPLPEQTVDLLQSLLVEIRSLNAYFRKVFRAGTPIFSEPTITTTAQTQIDLGADCFSLSVQNDGPSSVTLYANATQLAGGRTIFNGEAINITEIDPPIRYVSAATLGVSSALRIAGQA